MTKRALNAEDLFRFTLAEDVALSPDGQRIFFVPCRLDPETNQYRRHIAAISRSGAVFPLTQGTNDHAPAPSLDGRYLAFLASRTEDDPYTQLYLLPLTGGEARRLTHWAANVESAVWAPDSRSLVVEVLCQAEGMPPALDEWRRAQASAPSRTRFTEDVRHITRLAYRLDTQGYYRDRFHHLFEIFVDPDRPFRRLTHGPYHHYAPAFSPDGRYLAFSANRRPHADREPYQDIYVYQRETGEEQQVTSGNGTYTAPIFSPDSRTLYFLGHHNPYGFYSQYRLFTSDLEPSPTPPQELLNPGDWDFGNEAIDDMHRHADGFKLFADPRGNALYSLISHGGTCQVGAIDLATRSLRFMTQGEHVIYALCPDAQGQQFALALSDASQPGNIFWATLNEQDGSLSLKPATDLNRDILEEVRIALPRRFTFVGEPSGPPLDGFLLVPDGPGPHPLALEIHGGPMAMYAPVFFFEFQLLVAAGIGVVFTNPHGSRGYGEEFCAAIRGRWGHQDFHDVMAGLDAALTMDRFDPERLAVLGGSYGGFMTNWAIGHSDRFRAAVTMRSVVNELSFFGTSDVGFLDDWEWGGVPWRDPMRYLAESPWSAVDAIHTPLLILHSEEDYRCPISQAEELFTALKWLGREVEFVRFPGESHELSRSGKPWHRVYRLELIRQWLVRHLGLETAE